MTILSSGNTSKRYSCRIEKRWMVVPALLSVAITSTSLANVKSCRNKLHKGEIKTETAAADLDQLIEEINSKEPKASEDSASARESTLPSMELRKMPLSMLLSSLGLEAYQVRLASAELLKQNESGSHLQMKEEIFSLLEGIALDELNERQKVHLSSYKSMLEEIVRKSKAVHRFEVMSNYDKMAVPQTMSDIFVAPAPAPLAEPARKVGFFEKLFGRSNKNSKINIPQKEILIPYENPEQFSRALLEHPVEERIKIVQRHAATMGYISHLEIYRILMTIPTKHQTQGYQTLKANLIGRIDYYPLEVLRLAADVDSNASLDVVPIVPEIILADLRETGKHLDLFEVYDLLKTLKFETSDIAIALSGRAVTFEIFSEFVNTYSAKNSIDDILMMAGLYVRNYSSDKEVIEKARAFLKSVYKETESLKAIDAFFDQELQPKKEGIKEGPIDQAEPQADRPSLSSSGVERLQKILIGEMASVNWNYDRDRTYLFKSIEGIKNLRPVSNAIQTLRITALAKAMGSAWSDVRNSAGEAIVGIARKEQDADTQKLILTKVEANWNYDRDRQYLYLALLAAESIEPANADIESLRVGFLSKPQKSDYADIRNNASKILCAISSCDHLTEHNQLKLIENMSGVNWNYDRDRSYLLSSIRGISAIKPVSHQVQEARVKALTKALSSDYADIRNLTTEALLNISRWELDAHTQNLLLNNIVVNWNYSRDQTYLLNVLEAIGSLKSANLNIEERRIAFLSTALKSDYSNIRNKASEALFSISQSL